VILSIGQEFACSGIALERMGNVTRFLTLASLARALIDERLDHDNLKVGAANHPHQFRSLKTNYDHCELFSCFINIGRSA